MAKRRRPGSILRIIAALAAAVSGALWLAHTSAFIAPNPGATQLLSHRGVHQTFDSTGVGNDDCTATLIDRPVHGLLENTLASMAAAFEAGADIVELDLHLSADGHLVVFHDWTLDCRTNGTGNIADASLAQLRALDIGYGYSADGGATYPLRGTGTGLLPTLEEVFDALPDGRFMVHFKTNQAAAGEAFKALLQAQPSRADQIFAIYGNYRAFPTGAPILSDVPFLHALQMKSCLKTYAVTGAIGRVPRTCQNTVILVPVSHADWLWGWPHRFTRRMQHAGSKVVLIGPHSKGNSGSTGIDDAALLARVPDGFDGYIWTNRIEVIGPLHMGEAQ